MGLLLTPLFFVREETRNGALFVAALVGGYELLVLMIVLAVARPRAWSPLSRASHGPWFRFGWMTLFAVAAYLVLATATFTEITWWWLPDIERYGWLGFLDRSHVLWLGPLVLVLTFAEVFWTRWRRAISHKDLAGLTHPTDFGAP